MMRKFFVLILSLVIAKTGFVQINFNYLQTDSLRRELFKAKEDTTRVLLMSGLAEAYRWSNSDSAMFYGQNALALASKINFKRGEANALLGLSVVQRELGNLAKALDFATKALSIAQGHFSDEEITALLRVANVYSACKDYNNALIYLRQAESRSNRAGNALYTNISRWLIALAFEQKNELDSALHYANVALKNLSWDAGVSYAYNILGDIQLKLKKDSLALHSYWLGLKDASRTKDYRTAANLNISLANYYKNHNQIDSAIYYGKEGLAVAQLLSYKNRIIASSEILAQIYEVKDPNQSLKYYKIFNAAKDSLYGADKMLALQTLMIDEQEKQKEVEAKQLAYQNRIKQYGLLGGLLAVLIILLLLYRNNRRKQKANELLEKQKKEIEEQRAKAEIETALEKVRTIAMSMRKPGDMLEVCKVISQQLSLLGINEIRNVQTAIFYEEKGTYMNYEFYARHDKLLITEVDYKLHPAQYEFAYKMLKGPDELFTLSFEGQKLKDWYEYQKTTPQFADSFLETASSLNYYWYSMGPVALGISTYAPLCDNQIALFKRFRNVFELSYRRYLDIEKAEGQAREAQIEVALERVRSRTMGMQKSEELKKVIQLVYEQFVHLNIHIGHTGFLLDYKTRDDLHIWLADEHLAPSEVILPWFDSIPNNTIKEAKEKGQDFFKYLLTFEEKNKFYKDLFQLFPVPEEAIEYYLNCPALAGSGVLLENVGLYIENFSGTPYSDEDNAVLMRFGKVFQQTYTRFLDLKKAEEQAREAQIEAGLERVRSRAMGMQTSEELNALIGTVFTELTKLDLVLTRCVILIYEGNEKAVRWWMANSEAPSTPMSFFVKYADLPFFNAYLKGWEERSLKWQYILEGENKVITDDFLFTQTELSLLPDFVISGMRAPDRVYLNASFNNFGNLTLASLEPLSGEHFDILLRFAKVFDLTYTRFNDLKQAEAQARESQIQLALERVRARAMAMHQSDELKEVVALLFEQIKGLGFDAFICSITLKDKTTRGHQVIAAYDTQHLPQVYNVPYLEDPFWKRFIKAFDEAIPYKVFELGGIEKKELDKKWFTLTDFRFIPKELKQMMLDTKRCSQCCAYMKHGCITAIGDQELSTEQALIFRRFAKVFEQTYTRFLDLQKAEAQARESQIQLALERVRARTMAMQHSDELAETAQILFQQFKKLGEDPIQITIGIFNEAQNIIEFSITGGDGSGSKIDQTFNASIDEPTLMNKIFTAWKENKKSITVSLEGEELSSWIKFRNAMSGKYAYETKVQAGDRRYVSVGFFSKGILSISTTTVLSGETVEILERFASVFDLTYTRFLDLKHAEAQTREAQIEAALEKVRSRSLAMHKSDELKEAGELLWHELGKLGIESLSSGYVLMDKEEKIGWIYAPNPATGKIAEPLGCLHTETKEMRKVLEGWKKQELLTMVEMNEQETIAHQTFIAERTLQPDGTISNWITAEKLIALSPKRLFLHNFYFKQGYLLIVGGNRLTDKQIEVMLRFTKVFQQTFTRFLDLKKAEAQAREAEIEASLERVRSKTMAMHNSQDVSAATAVMFNEFSKLGVETMRCGIGVLHNDSEMMEVWAATTTKDGHEMKGAGQVSVKGHLLWQQMYADWKEKKESFLYHLRGEDLKAYYEALSNTSSYSAPYLKEKFEDHYCYATYFEDGVIFTFNYNLYTAEQKQVLKRFAAVFSLTYKRYKDLKKAESQAREATIEAALEKVRGKAMAMHNSNDLSATASIVFAELRKLGINPVRCGVGLLSNESRKALLYSAGSSPEGDSLSLMGWVMLSGHPVLEEIYYSWQKGEDCFPELQGDQLRSYYEILLKGLSVKIPERQKEQVQYGHFLSISVGCLYVWSDVKYNVDEVKILKRFAAIIELTFRRYLELQQSEANAKEAVKQAALDRIRADIASMRTVTDLDRITPLIWNELTTLNVPFIRCGVFIMDESQQLIHTFLSTPDGRAIAAFHIPYDTPGNIGRVLEHWREKDTYISHWSEVDFIGIAEILVKQGAVANKEQYLNTLPKDGFHLHFIPFLQGMLYVGNANKLNEEQIELLQHVADAFSTAYARYEDFNKLEAAKKQVDSTLNELKSTQQQLIQSEKMASLGELTAGIAHEIQNPLNFVNNFSEVSTELLDEISSELSKGDIIEAKAIVNDVKHNLEKIAHHGKRADAIVKSMLQHSRKSAGQKDLVDINSLVDEYLRMSYHGFRAKDKSFNAILETHFDPEIKRANIIGQDVGRVLLNLFNNAFYAVNEKKKDGQNGFEPIVQVTTSRINNVIEIKVKDNGTGIPEKVLEKIYQPFFTTKPTGEGTGLGLSLSYDIITKGHGGEMKVETQEGKGSEFIIQLPNSSSL